MRNRLRQVATDLLVGTALALVVLLVSMLFAALNVPVPPPLP